MYAHCHPVIRGGVSLLVINTSISAPRVLMLPSASERFTLDAATLTDGTVRLNGSRLEPAAHDLSRITGVHAAAGTLTFAPASITFLAVPGAGNTVCRSS
jgi:hypothetical protein